MNSFNIKQHYLHFNTEMRITERKAKRLQSIHYTDVYLFITCVQATYWHRDLSAVIKAAIALVLILIKQHHLTGFKLVSKAYFKCRCFAGQRVIIPIIQMQQRRPFHISWPFCFVAISNASVHFSSHTTQRAWFCFPFATLPFLGLRSLFCKPIHSNQGPWRLISPSARREPCLSQQVSITKFCSVHIMPHIHTQSIKKSLRTGKEQQIDTWTG